jgi:hypothetical protein
MGYRSDVAIKVKPIHQPAFEEILKKAEFDCYHIAPCTAFITDVKWYMEWDKVKLVENWLDTLDYEDYGFIRLGEDHDDNEIRGDAYSYDMHISRNIEF